MSKAIAKMLLAWKTEYYGRRRERCALASSGGPGGKYLARRARTAESGRVGRPSLHHTRSDAGERPLVRVSPCLRFLGL